MAITYEQLKSILTPMSGVLTVDGSVLDTPAVTAMFQSFFTDSTLDLTGVTTKYDDSKNTVTVQGNLAAYNVLHLDVAQLTNSFWTVLDDGTVSVVLNISPTNPDWELKTSFPLLTGSIFEAVDYANALFTLDSQARVQLPADFRASFGYADDLPAVADGFIKYLSLSTVVRFKDKFDDLGNLFDPPITVQGAIEIYRLINTSESNEEGNSRAAQVYPQICLNMSSTSTKTVTVANTNFTFSLQLASPLIEFVDTKTQEVGLVIASAMALRTSIEAGGVQIPAGALLYPESTTEIRFFTGRIPDGPQMATNELPSMFGAANVGELLETIPGFPLFDNVQLQGLSFTFELGTSLSFKEAAATVAAVFLNPDGSSKWSIFDGLLTVDQIGLEVTVDNTLDAGYTLFGSAKLFGSDVTLALTCELLKLKFICSLSQDEPIDIGAMLQTYFGIDGMDWTIDAASFQLMGRLTTPPFFSFQGAVNESWTIFGTPETGLTLGSIYPHLGVQYIGPQNALTPVYSGGITANVELAGATITVSASYATNQGWTFEGRSAVGQSVNLTEVLTSMAELFGIDVPTLPEVDIDQLSLKFNTLTTDVSVHGAVRAPILSYNLTNLPLVGPYLDPSDTICIRNLQFVATSTVNKTTSQRTTFIAATVVVGLGATDSLTLQIPIVGTLPPLPNGQKPPFLPPATTNPDTTGADPGQVTYPTAGCGIWIPIQKTFGPLSIQKLGFSVTLEGLKVQVNFSVSKSGVTVQVYGLGLTIALFDSFSVRPDLAGLGLIVKWDAVAFDGTLLSVGDGQYDGSIGIKIGRFGISALGSYATTDPPSFFLFVMVNAPIGGVPAFFVKGISGGFGFNRSLLMPPLAQVASYPLVLGATPGPKNPFGIDPSITTFTSAMAEYMAVSIGDYWGAAGLRFTTYGTLDSYALATVAWGTQLQIALLGMSTLTMPPPAIEESVPLPPVAYAQLAIEAVYTSSDGALEISGQLTPTSYVLSKKCQITGGFALYFWLPPSEYKGQFVVTLGGYNPYYQRPSYYPTVPLLGFTVWLGFVSVTGGVYFAITSHAAMMGISVNTTYKTGPFKAWFKVNADFLVQWKPFHYDIQAGASVGVSTTLQIGKIRTTMSVSAGATLHIWGPDFSMSGTIELLGFSFSFTTGAASTQTPAPIDWQEFQDSFLTTGSGTASPAPMAADVLATAASAPASTSTGIVLLQTGAGVLKDVSDKGLPVQYIVDPQTFELGSQSQIPVKTLVVNGTPIVATWNTTFGVAPMSVDPDDLTSSYSLTITRDGIAYDGCDFVPALGTAPKALWSPGEDLQSTLNAPADLANMAMGAQIAPRHLTPDETLPVAIGNLLFQQEQGHEWTWNTNPGPVSNPWDESKATETLTSTVNSPDIVAARANILADLICNGFVLSSVIDTEQLTHPDTLNLLAPVELAYLGETTAALASA